MPRDPRAYLLDIHEAAEAIAQDTASLDLDRYLADRTVRRATERNFQIIGEALRRLEQSTPELFGRIDHAREIVAFRNILVHAYFNLDHRRVWAIICEGVPRLLEQSQGLLAAFESET